VAASKRRSSAWRQRKCFASGENASCEGMAKQCGRNEINEAIWREIFENIMAKAEICQKKCAHISGIEA